MRVKPMRGGLNIFQNVSALRKDDTGNRASLGEYETNDGASLQSSDDDDMGDYDYNIETNTIVKTRHHNSVKASSRRSF